MKPEPSERLSERSRGDGPGCWRGMKRRKNSSTSSSSMPGTCGAAPLRRTACVVLMLTTALPCSSTRRVKSGSSRACGSTRVLNTASKKVTTGVTAALTAFIFDLPKLLRTILHCVGDALHARRGRLTHHGHHVIGDFAGIHVDRAHACHPRAHRLDPAFDRLDEHRDRGQAVRVDHLRRRARIAQPALELHHLLE